VSNWAATSTRPELALATLDPVDARSALFDLYGDHLRSRGGRAPIAALVRLLAPLGISAPAVRTAVSRMVRQGWLEPARMPEGPGYALTPRAAHRLDEAADRIYRQNRREWDGRWHLVIAERIRERSRRDRVRAALGYLGYAPLDESTWISPRPSPELDALLETEHVRAQRFLARYDGDDRGLAARAWDLDGLARAYERWLGAVDTLLTPGGGPPGPPGAGLTWAGDPPEPPRAGMAGGTIREPSELTPLASGPADEMAFATRSRFVHEWRKFLFSDPGVPPELLPRQWPGRKAAELFDAEAARLLPAASRFVDGCLRSNTRAELQNERQ
jgi:phenylacetic acid degradation operon negative regulatory protein